MRNERIRTYNFPQGRVTDHRIGLTLYKIDSVMDGDLDEIHRRPGRRRPGGEIKRKRLSRSEQRGWTGGRGETNPVRLFEPDTKGSRALWQAKRDNKKATEPQRPARINMENQRKGEHLWKCIFITPPCPEGKDLGDVVEELNQVLEDGGAVCGGQEGRIDLELEDERVNPKYAQIAVKAYLQRRRLSPGTPLVEIGGMEIGIYE